jgi:hypothetical protein
VLFLGHIAASLLLADATDSDRAATVAGNLLPDVVDKTGSWVLRAMPSGRWLAHGLPFYASVCLASRFFLEGRARRGFMLGYAGHLVCDLWGAGKVPWLAPFERPHPSRPFEEYDWRVALVPEVVGAVVIWWLSRGRAGAGAPGAETS